MTIPRLLYWLLAIITIGIYLVMVVWTLPEIASFAGGQIPFDMRPTGYTYEDASDFLQALSIKGRDLYINTQHWLDFLYPGLLAILLTITFVKLASPAWAALLSLFAIGGGLFDYLENFGVANMLKLHSQSPELVTPELVAKVSNWTVFKSASTTVAFIALLVLLVKWAFVKLREKKAAKT